MWIQSSTSSVKRRGTCARALQHTLQHLQHTLQHTATPNATLKCEHFWSVLQWRWMCAHDTSRVWLRNQDTFLEEARCLWCRAGIWRWGIINNYSRHFSWGRQMPLASKGQDIWRPARRPPADWQELWCVFFQILRVLPDCNTYDVCCSALRCSGLMAVGMSSVAHGMSSVAHPTSLSHGNTCHTFLSKCYTPEIHQIEKLKFPHTNTNQKTGKNVRIPWIPTIDFE